MLETWHDALRVAERSVLERSLDPELRGWLERTLHQRKTNSDLAPDEVVYLAALLDSLSLSGLAEQLLGNYTGALSRNARALLAAAHGWYGLALEEFESALLDPGAATLRSRILTNLAAASLHTGQLAASERWLNLALSVKGGDDDPALDFALASTRAGIAQARGDIPSLRTAAESMAQATRRRVAQLDRGHPQSYISLADLAMVELELARVDRSAEKLGQVVTTLEAAMCGIAVSLGQHHPQTLVVSANLCAAELDVACVDGSAHHIYQVVEMSRQTYIHMRESFGDTHLQTILMAANVATAELEHARATDVASAARRAVAAMQTAYDRLVYAVGDDHPTAVTVLVNLASARLDIARRERTPEKIEQAVAALDAASDRVGRAFSADHHVCALIQREAEAGRALMHGDPESCHVGAGVAVIARTTMLSDSFNVPYLSFHEAARRAEKVDSGTAPGAAENRSTGDADQERGIKAPRIRLGIWLRSLRSAAGISREEAGYAIRSSMSKISRMELGQAGFKERDVFDLLTLYGVGNDETRDGIMELVRQANSQFWWQSYDDIIPDWFTDYIGLESSASLIRAYEIQFVPGLLQTEDYARAVAFHGHRSADVEEIDQRVQFRMRRKELLRRPSPPQIWAVIDEMALRRPIGGVQVLRDQIVALREATEMPNVTIQIMPSGVGGHSAAGGAFSILRFPEFDLPDVVYIEQMIGATYLTEPGEVDYYTVAMDHLCAESPPPSRTPDILTELIANLARQF